MSPYYFPKTNERNFTLSKIFYEQLNNRILPLADVERPEWRFVEGIYKNFLFTVLHLQWRLRNGILNYLQNYLAYFDFLQHTCNENM